ncbi:hypothetical protein AB0M79_08595 [Polymorphospora sp. NPDC051019]|uniref:hypothetical protein n=1 Tax=Polymorphospora sp. NPDC051019 TaxID=3155725 RepID=UPI003439199B
MSDRTRLERRYRRLLWAYPKDYRARRGDEIVGTYLELAGTDRRRPSPADAVDLLRGGLRQHLRMAGPDVVAGAHLAAVLALATAVAMAAIWLVYFELGPREPLSIPLQFGPFWSLGAVPWIAWLAVGLVAVVAPRRRVRIGIGAAIVLTGAVVPASVLTGTIRPPLFVLLPQIALGLVALALPARPTAVARVVPFAGAVLFGALPAVLGVYRSFRPLGYWNHYDVPAGAALLLSVVAVLAAVTGGVLGGGAARGGGVWTMLMLAPPVGLLATQSLATTYLTPSGQFNASWAALLAVSVAATVLTTGVLGLALALRTRRHGHRL